MLINASHPEENRVAIVVDGILSELDIEIAGQEQSKGNIYKAVVVRVETGLQAAFVDYGAEKLGFLQIGEIHPNLYPPKDDTKGRPRIADILKRGQEIMVQIVKEERGNKGAALTTFLSIPGRYMVLMPDSTTKGVSRKISDDVERKKLKKTMAELDLPERMGYIVRTAGIGKDKEELKRDFDYLVRLFEGITNHKDQIKAPAQLYQESNLAIRSIRDYFTTDIDEVLIDAHTVYQDAKDFFSLVMPELVHLVKQHRERRPIFSRYQIEEQIDALSKNQTSLQSGGSIVIDQTEALVAIDVNSGKMASESGIEATALKTNVEAAAEVGRQLRLRDLGGLVVIDFIDMRDRKNTREVEQALRKALKNDKAKVSVGRISQFGLLEMSRQRLKPVLSVGSYLDCPHCKGAGKIKSAEAQAVTLLRQIHTTASKGNIAQIDAKVPMDVANYLLNQKRSTIVKLEQQLDLDITIYGSSKLLPGEIDVEARKKEKDQDRDQQIAPISHANQIEVALAAQQDDQNGANGDDKVVEPSGQDQPAGETPQEPVKKKRRRRRRKPVAKNNDAQTTEQPTSAEPPETATTTEQPATEDPTATTASEGVTQAENNQEAQETVAEATAAIPVNSANDSEDPKAAEEEKKPRRRSRRAPRKKPLTETTAAPTETSNPDPNQPAETPQTTAETATSTEKGERPDPNETAEPTPETSSVSAEKPKRRPRRTSSAAKKVAEKEEVMTSAPQGADISGAEAETGVIEKPKRRTRRAPAKKAPVSVEAAPAATEAVAVETQTESTADEKASEDKPKRRTRRSPSKAKANAAAEVATLEDQTTTVSDATVTEEKPKRRTRRTTAKPKTATENEAPLTEEAQPSEQAEEKPKRRTRKTTAKAKVDVKETGTTDQGVDTPEAVDAGEEKPKRRTRKTPVKTAKKESTTETTVTTTEQAATPAAEEKPKRRPRRTTKKTTVAPTEDPGSTTSDTVPE